MRCFGCSGYWQCMYRAHILGSTVVCGATLESSDTWFAGLLSHLAATSGINAMHHLEHGAHSVSIAGAVTASLVASAAYVCCHGQLRGCVAVYAGPTSFCAPAHTTHRASTPRHTMALCFSCRPASGCLVYDSIDTFNSILERLKLSSIITHGLCGRLWLTTLGSRLFPLLCGKGCDSVGQMHFGLACLEYQALLLCQFQDIAAQGGRQCSFSRGPTELKPSSQHLPVQ